MPQLSPNTFIKNSGIFFGIVCLIYLIVAIKSSGYHQEDEHYQIIEFANYKLGLIPEYKLAWEFAAQIRPSFQPMICYMLFNVFNFFGVENGYDLTLLLRILTAIFSLFIIRGFINQYKCLLSERLHPYFIFTSYLLWFIPFISVRFSSETWAGLFYLLSLTILQNPEIKERASKYFLVGAILGVSILFRYQSGLLAFGIILWLWHVKKVEFKLLLTLCGSIAIIIAYGVLIDFWFYGEFVLTIYNYFYFNIIKDVASNYGVSPWYEILIYIVKAPGPIGVPLIISLIVVLYYEPKSLLLWSTVPFLIVHTIIPHKELRFLFTIAYLVPIVIFVAMQKLSTNTIILKTVRRAKPVLIGLASFCAISNLAGVIAISTTSAGKMRASVTEYIDRNYNKKDINIIFLGGANPYIDWAPLRNSFYNSYGIDKYYLDESKIDNVLKYRKKGKTNLLIIDTHFMSSLKYQKLVAIKDVKQVFQNIPGVTSAIFEYYNPELNSFALCVFELPKDDQFIFGSPVELRNQNPL